LALRSLDTDEEIYSLEKQKTTTLFTRERHGKLYDSTIENSYGRDSTFLIITGELPIGSTFVTGPYSSG